MYLQTESSQKDLENMSSEKNGIDCSLSTKELEKAVQLIQYKIEMTEILQINPTSK